MTSWVSGEEQVIRSHAESVRDVQRFSQLYRRVIDRDAQRLMSSEYDRLLVEADHLLCQSPKKSGVSGTCKTVYSRLGIAEPCPGVWRGFARREGMRR